MSWNVLDRKSPMRKVWLISLGGSSVVSCDACLGLESELLSGFLLDFFFCMVLLEKKTQWLPCNLRFLNVNHLLQFTPKVYVHMGHGHEIIALAAQPAEPKHAKCVNADKRKKRDARNHSPMQQEVLKWNLQLILWICLHKGHTYELRPAIPAKSSEQKWRNQFELLLRNGWVLHKVLKWFLPTHSVDLSS